MDIHSTAAPDRTTDGTRRIAYVMLGIVAACVVGAGIRNAPPAFSVNDLSRWATVRALVDHGTYAIGHRDEHADGPSRDSGIMTEPDWFTVDIVMDPESRTFYSSKPLLLPTVVAGEYWLLRNLLGWDIVRHRYAVTRAILLVTNWLPFVFSLILFVRLADRLGRTDFGRLLVFATVCLGTFATGFLTSLNNHTVAAAGAMFALYHTLRLHLDADRRPWRFLAAGFFAGWMVCNALPSASLAAGLLLWLAHLSWRQTLRYALPAMLIPVAAFFYVQYEALGWVLPTYALADWYEFDGSYWLTPSGMDLADDPKPVYAFHLLVGHTGILSLTPVLLLGWIGMIRGASRRPWSGTRAPQRMMATLALAVTALVFVFFALKTSNYGGLTAGPRWFFWLTPLWLLTMLPEADRWASNRWLRWTACGLLAISIGTALFALENPWRHNWLFATLRALGWIVY
jgi:hypothetical protein